MLRKNMEAYLRRKGQTAADAGVAARIRDRALTQRDASRTETAEAKDSV